MDSIKKFFMFLLNGIKKGLTLIGRLIGGGKKNDLRDQFKYGPTNGRRLLVFGLLFMAAAAGVASFINSKGAVSIKSIIDRDTAFGVKVPSEYSKEVSTENSSAFFKTKDEESKNVDCEMIWAKYKKFGHLGEKENWDLLNVCAKNMKKGVAELLNALEDPGANLTPEQKSNVLGGVKDDDNAAANAAKALQNADVLDNIRKNNDAVTKNIGVLGSLDDDELKSAMDALNTASPQQQTAMVQGIVEASQLQNKEARKSMIKALQDARDPGEVQDARKMIKALGKLSEEEQENYAEAYANAKDKDSRKALIGLTDSIAQLPADDPLRRDMATKVLEISKLSPDEQAKAYTAANGLTQKYAKSKDQEIKDALLTALVESSPSELQQKNASMDQVAAIQSAGGNVPKDIILEALGPAGDGEEFRQKIAEAAAIQKETRDSNLVNKFFSGEMSEEDKNNLLKNIGDIRAPGGNSTGKSGGSKEDLDNLENERDAAESERNKAAMQIRQLTMDGVSPVDPQFVAVSRRLTDADEKVRTTEAAIEQTKAALKAEFDSLKSQTSAQFANMGVVFPDLKLDFPKSKKAGPPPRLSNLSEYEEFWGDTSGKAKKGDPKRFRFVAADGSDGGPKLASSAFAKKKTWYVQSPGSGSSMNQNVDDTIEISRLDFIPGELINIPKECYPSDTVGSATVHFRFLTSVVSRKTGRIEIPKGAVAICKLKTFSEMNGRLEGTCRAVDVGAPEDLTVKLVLVGADMVDGVPGEIRNNRFFYLLGAFVSSFAAGVIDYFNNNKAVSTLQSQLQNQQSQNYVLLGAQSGAATVLTNVAQTNVENWQKKPIKWCGYNGMIATVRQE